MATIVIKDLSESIALDREAMVAITGGARMRQPYAGRNLRVNRLVSFPKGFVSHPLTDANKQTAGSKSRK